MSHTIGSNVYRQINKCGTPKLFPHTGLPYLLISPKLDTLLMMPTTCMSHESAQIYLLLYTLQQYISPRIWLTRYCFSHTLSIKTSPCTRSTRKSRASICRSCCHQNDVQQSIPNCFSILCLFSPPCPWRFLAHIYVYKSAQPGLQRLRSTSPPLGTIGAGASTSMSSNREESKWTTGTSWGSSGWAHRRPPYGWLRIRTTRCSRLKTVRFETIVEDILSS